jgi:hypothetical protein
MPTVAVASSSLCQSGRAVTSAEFWIDGAEVYYFTVAYSIPVPGPYSISDLQINGGEYVASADFGAPASSPAESTWVFGDPNDPITYAIPEASAVSVGNTWNVCANFFINAGEVTVQTVYRIDGFVRVNPPVG